jgi:hypothetical protein
VAGCCECGDESSGSCATELVRLKKHEINLGLQNYAVVGIYTRTAVVTMSELGGRNSIVA